MLSHDVFFTLKDASDEAIALLIQGCQTHLRKHAGVEWFSVGGRQPDFARDVNDCLFHVALHLTFRDRASHDVYQDAPEHGKFIEENQDNWANARVFDSEVEGGVGG